MEAANRPSCKERLLDPKYHCANHNLDSKLLLAKDLTEFRQLYFSDEGSYYDLVIDFHSCHLALVSNSYQSTECSYIWCPDEWRLCCEDKEYPCTFTMRKPRCLSLQNKLYALAVFIQAAKNPRFLHTLALYAGTRPEWYYLMMNLLSWILLRPLATFQVSLDGRSKFIIVLDFYSPFLLEPKTFI